VSDILADKGQPDSQMTNPEHDYPTQCDHANPMKRPEIQALLDYEYVG